MKLRVVFWRAWTTPSDAVRATIRPPTLRCAKSTNLLEVSPRDRYILCRARLLSLAVPRASEQRPVDGWLGLVQENIRPLSDDEVSEHDGDTAATPGRVPPRTREAARRIRSSGVSDQNRSTLVSQ